jgi:hypothetical protein
MSGSSEASYLKLDAARQNAVVRVDVFALDGSPRSTCSGVLIAPRLVLTVKHCGYGPSLQAFVQFGPDATAPIDVCTDTDELNNATSPSAAVVVKGTRSFGHTRLDLMLIELDADPVASGIEVTPIPVGGDAVLAVGRLAQLAGYGRNEMSTNGPRRFVVEEVTELDQEFVTVDGHGRSGMCTMDSGGPLLVRGEGGRVFTAGVLVDGSSDCLGKDYYARLSQASDWLAGYTGAWVPTGTADEASCGLLTAQGRCFGPMAVWCEEASLRAEDCRPSTGCGWSTGAGGFRCVASPEDPCLGVSDIGVCVGENATLCERGVLSHTTCTSCGRSPKSGVVQCV